MERERYERYEGKVARVRFAGGSGDGYMIADVVDGRGRKETIVGVLHDAVVGTLIEAEIERVSHPKFGAQLKIVGSAKTSPPTDKNGLAIFLSGCPEITEAKARKLVDAISIESGLWDAIRNASPRVIAIVGEEKARKLADWFTENEALKEARIKLADWGLDRRQVTAACAKWKLDTLRVVEANPWILAEEIDGIGWLTADMLAQRLKKPAQCIERARAAVLHLLAEAAQDGHAYCEEDALISSARSLAQLRGPVTVDAIRALAHDKRVVLDVGEQLTAIYRANLYAAEAGIARMIAELVCSPEVTP